MRIDDAIADRPTTASASRAPDSDAGARRVLELIDQPVVWVAIDDHGDARICDLNRAACSWLQRTVTNTVGRRLSECAPFELAREWTRRVRQALQDGTDSRWVLPQGDTELQLSVLPAVAAAPARVVSVLREFATTNRVPREIERDAELLQAVRLADERWRFAIENSGDGLWDWDIEHSTVSYSRRWAEILGIAHDKIGTSTDEWASRVHPDDFEAIIAQLQQHLDGRLPSYMAEHRLRTADGEWKWVLGRGLVVSRDAQGKPLRMLGINTDIDSAKRDSERVEHLRQRLQLAIRGSRFGVWEFDLASDRLIWDEQMFAIYGHTPATFDQTADRWRECLHARDRATVDAHFQELIDGKIVDLFEFRIIRADDGAERRIEANGYLQRDAQGLPQRLVGMNRDITEAWQASQQLLLLGTSLSRLQDMVLILQCEEDGASNRIVYANAAFMQRTGYSQGDLETLLPSLLRDSHTGQPVVEALMASAATRGSLKQEVKALTKSFKELWIDLDVVPMPAPDGNPGHWVLIGHDISERKAAEREILALNAELERRVFERTAQLQASNEELQAFTYAVSHDLRAPLRGVDGWSEALEQDCAQLLDDVGRSYLTRIRHEVQRMGDMVSALLRLSRVATTELATADVDLSSIARAITGRLHEEYPGRIVHTRIAPGIRVHADAQLMSLMLTNLLENCWKFTASRPEARIDISTDGGPGVQIVSISDNGVGFDMRHIDELFEPFKRLHRASEYPGTGIGLATVDRIMRRHGGKIIGTGVVGEGATFRLVFDEARS